MEKLTQKRLKELLDYYPDIGEFFWLVDRKGTRAGNIAGFNKGGYTQIGIEGSIFYAHRLAWLYVYGYFPENGIDHINRNKSDNRICNLREVSRSCNLRNTGNKKNNTSSIKGVSWHKPTKRWHSQIGLNRKVYNLGYYHSFDEAVYVRLAAEQCLNWSGCDSNSPAFLYVQKMLKKI